MAQTADRDQFTFGPNRDHFGPNGKINAIEGMRLILKSIIPPYIIGDVNNDGVVNMVDITRLIQYLLNGSNGNDGVNERAADVDRNGVVNTADLNLLIYKVINGDL